MTVETLPTADAAAPATGHTLRWAGGSEGRWDDACNWTDDLTGTIAGSPPGATDTAIVDGGVGVRIDGDGAARSLILSGTIQIDGNLRTTSLVDTDTTPGARISVSQDASLTITADPTLVLSDPHPVSAGLPTGMDVAANTHPGSLVVEAGASLVLPVAVIAAPIWNDGVVTIAPNSAVPPGEIDGSGVLLVEPGFKGNVQPAAWSGSGPVLGMFQQIRFDGPNASLCLNNGGNTVDTPILVENFQPGNTIAVWGTPIASTVTPSANGDLLDLTELMGGLRGQTIHQFFRFDNDPEENGFAIQTVFHPTGAFDAGYTTVSLQQATTCFCPGTRIATPVGDRAIEDLRIGDRITTADGDDRPILWIGRRSYDIRFARSRPSLWPILIRAGALGAGRPRRDLFVSPRHAMLVRDVLVPAELLVNDRSILRQPPSGDISYLHIELENHDLLLAEGAATESFVDDNSRILFENAAEYAALYPDRDARLPAWCRPRVDDGEALLAAQSFVDMLAGRSRRRRGPALQGSLDRVENGIARGWAWSPEHPNAPLLLEFLCDGEPVARELANLYRADLAEAGIGTGCHGFEAALPHATGAITIRHVRDASPLAI